MDDFAFSKQCQWPSGTGSTSQREFSAFRVFSPSCSAASSASLAAPRRAEMAIRDRARDAGALPGRYADGLAAIRLRSKSWLVGSASSPSVAAKDDAASLPEVGLDSGCQDMRRSAWPTCLVSAGRGDVSARVRDHRERAGIRSAYVGAQTVSASIQSVVKMYLSQKVHAYSAHGHRMRIHTY